MSRTSRYVVCVRKQSNDPYTVLVVRAVRMPPALQHTERVIILEPIERPDTRFAELLQSVTAAAHSYLARLKAEKA